MTDAEKRAAAKRFASDWAGRGNEPSAAKFARQIYGAAEFINGKARYCLWFVGASPAELRKSPFIMERVEQVRQFRLNSTKEATKRSADTPTLFQEIRHPDSEYIIIPCHSSETRRYIPFGFVSPEILANNAVQLIPGASLADLYDKTAMFPELRRAHQQNDKAVMQAYGFSVRDMTESKCVVELMRMYQKLTEQRQEA